MADTFGDEEGSIEALLQSTNVILGDDGYKTRELSLKKIELSLQKWVTNISKHQGRDDKNHGSRVHPFGGYKIGTVTKTSDLDVLCVVPKFIPRDEFFESFLEVLKMECPGINCIRCIPAARVPIIKLNMSGIEFDLCLACLNMDSIPRDIDFTEEPILEGMDIVDVRSLNGLREVISLLGLVPDLEIYRPVLFLVKLWAKAKGINESVLGYPGGFAWAILLAKVHQTHQAATTNELLSIFFKTYSTWHWPDPVSVVAQNRADPYNLKPWNPRRNRADQNHVMPVITPAYPEKNCASTVTSSGLKLTIRQLKEATNVISQGPFSDLLIEPDFYRQYKHYICVIAKSSVNNPDAHADWSSLVYSKMRIFLEHIEEQPDVELVHAYPRHHEDDLSTKWFWGLEFKDTKVIRLELAETLAQFQEQLEVMAKQRSLHCEGQAFECQHLKKKQLKDYLH